MFSRKFQLALTKEIFANSGSDRMHDVMLDLTGERMNKMQLKSYFVALPETIQCDALKWGLSDTEVAGAIYEYYEKRLKNDE